MNKILIVGAGSFGTSLAACFSHSNKVTILARSNKNFAELQQHAQLSSCVLQSFDTFDTDFMQFDFIVLAVPCQSLRTVCEWMWTKWQEVRKHSDFPALNLVSTSKGIEKHTLSLPYEILQNFWQEKAVVATLSGPTFAKELLQGLPSAVVLASKNKQLLASASSAFHSKFFHVYDSEDVVGVEIGGALKNVVALAAGVVDGLNLGHNARAALVTRGLAEIARVGVKLGANPITFLGLSGVGDLILTSTSHLSRNRQFGYRLGLGETLSDIIGSFGQVVEGYATSQSAFELCQKLNVRTTILDGVYRVLYENLPVERALETIIARGQASEFNWN